jgi:putative flippase GtrA
MSAPARCQRLLTGTRGRLLRELGAFGVVGFGCFLLDVGLFQLLYVHVGTDAVSAKLVATVSSMTIAYLGHRYWSFTQRTQAGHRRQFSLFAAINTGTLLLGLAIVATVRYPLQQDGALVLQLANITSIVAGTVIRWLAYRRWVFPTRADVEPSAPVHVGGRSAPTPV